VPEFRRLRDPRALNAIAHPVRMGIVELLTVEGALTATELADRLDETPANCSWHLRKLAEHEFIEEAPGGTGRQRPWRMKHVGMTWGGDDAEPDERRAGEALSRAMLERWLDRFLDASARLAANDPTWSAAADLTQAMGWLTPEELRQVNDEVEAVVMRFAHRLDDPDSRPEGSRLVEMVAWGAPVEVGR
jgi:predicted ArsR family transcriptional regulator